MTTLRPLEAENAVIGAILISPECLPVAAGILSPGDFGLEANRQLFQAALALTRAGKPADPVLLGQEVRRVGGSVSNEYIMQLMDATPTAANVEEYARLTREDAVARGIKAGDIIKAIAPICGGKGGGKPDSAMGGGTEPSKVDDALAAVDDFVAGKL